MAESSMFWTTSGTGDGNDYTQDQWFDFLTDLFLRSGDNGVILDASAGLAVTGAASPLSVSAGSALVGGVPYRSTAAVSVAVATPIVNTTGHRVIIRADADTQQARIALLSSADGVAAAPAITQDGTFPAAGTVWEISLATLTITTLGAVTVTDARVYVRPNIQVITSMIADLAVTTGKINDLAVTTGKINDLAVTTGKLAADSVDDTKAGNRVPQMYRRQGGDANNWGVFGTTTYTPGAVRVQVGATRLIGDGASTEESITITFPVAFSQAPLVICSVSESSDDVQYVAMADNIGATTVDITVERNDGAAIVLNEYANVAWLAIGTE